MIARTLLRTALTAAAAMVAGWVGPARSDAAEAAAPRPFAESRFDDFYESDGWPDEAALRALLAEAPGAEARLEKAGRHEQSICRISGQWRLKPAWQADSALRLSLAETRDFQVHFWAGRRGVTLCFYHDFHRTWAAYGTTRAGAGARPDQRVLWATDQGRYRRTGTGTVAVYHCDGSLILARGDVRLLTVPLAERPSEVVLDGRACVRGLAMFSVRGGPEDEPGPPGAAQALVLAKLAWHAQPAEGGVPAALPDGAVELAAGERTGEVRAWATVCRPGLREFVLEVENAQPGTGVFLAGEDGEPLARLGFFRDRRSGRTVFGLTPGEQRETERSCDENRPAPLAGDRQWFRVAAGAGVAKLFTSGDGLHWSQAEPGHVAVRGPVTRIGLYCVAGEKARAVRLRRASVRRLEALEAMAPAPQWTPQAFYDLAAEGAAKAPDVAGGLRLLDEAGLLCPCTDWPAADRWTACYERLGRLAEDGAVAGAYWQAWRGLVLSPFWAQRDLPPALERLLWYELARAMSEDRWEAAADLCRRLRFRARPEQWERQPPPWSAPLDHVVRCVEDRAAARKLALAPDRPVRAESDYRHPLIEQWGKEGYNVKTELEAALDAEALREACQVIVSARSAATEGLLPDARDPRLLVSLPGVIAQAMDDSPELRRTMREEFGRVGELRLRQAVVAGDAAAVELIAVQFAGSEAAADAHRWLGDRRMASGRFAEAAGQYRQALRSAAEAGRADLQARLLLALAMQGVAGEGDSPVFAPRTPGESPAGEPGQSPAGPVALGEAQMSGPEFAQLLEELARSRAPDRRQTSAPAAALARGCPAPGPCRVRALVVAEGGAKKPSHYSATELDWAGRETAAAVAGPLLVIATRCEHLGVDLATGQHVWRHLRHIPSAARAWPLTATPPVCAMDRVFVRRFADGAWELACLDRVGGRMLWAGTGGDYVASDAVLVGQGAWALTVRRTEGQKSTLMLVRFDPATGRVLRRASLVDFRGFLNATVPGQAAAEDDRIVATAGGAVVCCDLAGRLCWVRRQAWIAPPGHAFYDSRAWLQQRHAPPILVDGRAYVTQPGTWNVECLDVQTGRLHWRATLSELVGLAGVARGMVVAEMSEGLAGLDAQSGRVAWRHDAPQRLEGLLCGEPGGIVYARLRPDDDPSREGPRGEQARRLNGLDDPARKGPRVALVWIDPADGAEVAEHALDLPAQAKPLVGPLVSDGKRLWAFYGAADDTARREVFEVVFTGENHASSSTGP